MTDVSGLGVVGVAAAVRNGEVSPREMVEHALHVIEQLNGRYHAFVAVDAESALAHADDLGRRIARHEPVGPLAGVPLGVKDLEDALGFTTTCGSAAFASAPPASRDSVQVARLRAAGCIVIGKTNCPEFGLRGETDNRTFGITRNPWDPSRTPGGSSGGSSAAVCAGMVPLATASDGGGSIRIPSSVTGLSGLKPTNGIVPDGDPAPVGWGELSTRGPMARTACDIGAALDVVAGPDPRDIRSLPAPVASFLSAASRPVRPVRVAWSPTLGYAHVDDEVLNVCGGAINQLSADGVDITEVSSVFSSDPTAALGVLVSTYIRRTVEPFRGTPMWDQLDPLVQLSAEISRVTVSDALTLVAAQDACHDFNLELQAVLDHVDVLLCPVTAALPPHCENPVAADRIAAMLSASPAADAFARLGFDDPDGFLADLRRCEPFNIPIGTVNGRPVGVWHGLTQAFNMTRSPVGTVCVGFSVDGLPVGIQIVGRRLDDALILSIMSYLEALFGLDLRPMSLRP